MSIKIQVEVETIEKLLFLNRKYKLSIHSEREGSNPGGRAG